MACVAFWVTMTSEGELFRFVMPAVSTPAAPSTPVVSTPSAITVSASENPLFEDTFTLYHLPRGAVPAIAADAPGRAEHGDGAIRGAAAGGNQQEHRAVGGAAVPVDQRAIGRELHHESR